MYSFIRKGIFSLEPETAHDLAIKTLGLAKFAPIRTLLKQLFACPQGTPKTVMGIEFKKSYRASGRRRQKWRSN